MAQEHTHPLRFKHQFFGACAAHDAGVDVAADGAHHRGHGAQALYDVDAADVAGVPYLVASGEMAGIAVVPGGVSVGKDAYLHFK